MEENTELKRYNEVKSILLKFTDEFSSEDISFIRSLDFPSTITVTDLDLKDSSPNKVYSRTIESIEDLENEFKRLPQNCEVVIPDISGKMRLCSRV